MNKPIIGISVNFRPEARSYGEFRISKSYVDFIVKAGGLPQLIPIVNDQLIPKLFEIYDGMLFSGGGGLLPHIQKMDELPKLKEQNPERYTFEVRLIQEAVKRNIPILGVCRGHQMINDALGGTIKNLNDESHRQSEPYDRAAHYIDIDNHSQLYRIVGTKRINVNSLHRQVVDHLGTDLRATAYSSEGYIEAIETTNDQFIMGVQFHPELMPKDTAMLGIYQALVKAAKENKK